MALDPVKNFGKVTVSTGYNSAAVSIALTSGDGAKLPAPSTDGAFNLVWYNSTDYNDPTDDPSKEIVRCTARSTDTLTITRAQESTTAYNHNTGGKTYKMLLSFTKKVYDDIDGLLKFGGTGSDGALSTSSGTVDIDLGSADVVTKNYTSINIATNNLTFSNPGTNGTIVVLKSQGDVTISASINVDGIGATGGIGGNGSSGSVGNGGLTTVIGRSNYGYGGGLNIGSDSPGSGGTAIYYINSLVGKSFKASCGAGGGGGGSGAATAGGDGGDGGGVLIIECGGALNFSGTITALGTVGATAGNSGSGGAGGGGGGGAGGTIILSYNTLTANSGTLTVTGGAGGSGGNGLGTDNVGDGGGGGGNVTSGAAGSAGSRPAGDGGAGGAGGNGQSLVVSNTEIS